MCFKPAIEVGLVPLMLKQSAFTFSKSKTETPENV